MAFSWQRLWAKVQVDPLGGCWEWRGALSQKRRGLRPVMGFREGGQVVMVNVTRQICKAAHGPAPSADHHAGHTCPEGENARCVNPAHLRWMTPIENEQFKQARGNGRNQWSD